MIGVYKIQSYTVPDRIYIGSGKNIRNRWNTHLYLLRHNKHHSKKLQNHYNKYGEQDLHFNILMECEIDKLLIKEQCYINIFQPYFNCSKIAKSREGVKWSNETRQKRKLPPWTDERRKAHSERLIGNKRALGFKHTEETKAKHRIKFSEETKLKMKKHALDIYSELKERLNIARTHIVYKPHSEETKLKISLANKGRKRNKNISE